MLDAVETERGNSSLSKTQGRRANKRFVTFNERKVPKRTFRRSI